MISIVDRTERKLKREYACTPEREIELCFANIECLLEIALLDSDEHIRELGGEQELLELMNRYVDLANRIRAFGEKEGEVKWE